MQQHRTGRLAGVPGDAHGHFRLRFYGAVLDLVAQLLRLGGRLAPDEPEGLFDRFPFLAAYLEAMRPLLPDHLTRDQAPDWWDEQITAWEHQCTEPLPLLALAADAGIGPAGLQALILVGLVEEDSRFGTLFAYLQAPLPHHRPTTELVGRLVGHDLPDGEDAWSLCRPLLAAGLLDVANPESPRSEWALSVPTVLWEVIRGDVASAPLTWCRYQPPTELPRPEDLILPDEMLTQLIQLPALLQDGKADAVIIRGMQGSERQEALATVARALDRGVLTVDGSALEIDRRQERLGPLCTLTRSLPVIRYELSPGEVVQLPALKGYHGPVGILLGAEGGVRGAFERPVTLHLPPPDAPRRLRYWQRALAGYPCPDLAEISARFQIPGGYILQAGAMAVARAGLEGRSTITISDVRAACRSLNRQVLETLAVRLDARGSWSDLVVSDPIAAKLQELERRCRHRERLLGHLSPVYGGGTNRGVRAIFSGPSGTGKTLAAKILAAVLDMDIYRVDLAAVVNRYIGETEKNLNQVLSRAEELDVILLLDEGDSLLAKRSEVKSANDRYANLETNYLLQRLEHYQGIVLVTTNASDYIDKAFERRMDTSIDFQPPGPAERMHIWALHLPPDHAVPPEFLEEVAIRCTMTGGQIRNAALQATLLALDRQGPLARRDLEEAIRSEYRKAGALCPLDPNPTAHGGMQHE